MIIDPSYYSQLKSRGVFSFPFLFGGIPIATGCVPYCCGYSIETDPGNYRWDGQQRGNNPFTLFQYTLGGRGAVRFEEDHYEITRGDLLLLNIPHDHCYYLPANSPEWEFIYVCIGGSEIRRMAAGIIKKHGPVIPLSDAKSFTANLFKAIMVDRDRTSIYKASSLCFDICTSLLEYLFPEAQHIPGKSPALRKARNLAETRCGTGLAVEDMARSAGYSRHHFTRLFTDEFGVSPGEFLTRLKVRRGAELLLNTSDGITAVAEKCGFYDGAYFAKVFRKIFNMSPAAFRRSGAYQQ